MGGFCDPVNPAVCTSAPEGPALPLVACIRTHGLRLVTPTAVSQSMAPAPLLSKGLAPGLGVRLARTMVFTPQQRRGSGPHTARAAPTQTESRPTPGGLPLCA